MSVVIHQGDCVQSMKKMAAKSVHCCITSPPYFGLRDYGCAGQIGLEKTPEEFVASLVAVFQEVHRVLRDDGTLWLNLGDSYNNFRVSQCGQSVHNHEVRAKPTDRKSGVHGLKEKDLIGVPWRVAFALQADGWYLRQDIIWHKPNPMPESVQDRCTKAHEYLFLLSKKEKYYFDSGAMQEPAIGGASGNTQRKQRPGTDTLNRGNQAGAIPWKGKETRNRRSVWVVNTKPYKGAHFATFPPDLIRPCVKAGCPTGGTVLDPFGGSGTTGQVAQEEDRNAVLCELNPEYVHLANARVGIQDETEDWI